MKIGEKTITEVTDQVEGLTRAWLLNINDAFRKFGGQDFSITYTSKFSPDTQGVRVVTEIKFRPEPDVKDKASGVVDEDQMSLFEKKKDIPFKDRRGQVGASTGFYRGIGAWPKGRKRA